MSMLSGFQDTKWTILFLSCLIGFIDETLMTIPVPILPNLFLAKCQSQLFHEHFDSVADTRYREDKICSEELSAELETLCDVEHTGLGQRKIAYIINASNQICETFPTGRGTYATSSRMANQTEYYQVPLTGEVCEEWGECKEGINVQVGIILSAKFFMRIVLSPLLTVLPKYTGFLPVHHLAIVVGIMSCLVYASSSLFPLILSARLLHGISASLLAIGMGGLTNFAFRENDKERGIAVGMKISFMALGSVVGPPFGGLIYYILGNAAPYLIVATGYILYLGLSLTLLNENSRDESVRRSGLYDIIELVIDPYICVSTLGLTLAASSVSIIESALPHWMITEMSSPSWLQGIIYLPMAGMAVPCGILSGFAGTRIPRWLMVLAGFFSIGTSLLVIPVCRLPQMLILPMVLLGAGFGTLDSTLAALTCRIAYERYAGMYAASVVIPSVAFSFGFALGPSIMGALINFIGFKCLITGLGCIVTPFALASLILRIGENALDEKKREDDANDQEKDKLILESQSDDG